MEVTNLLAGIAVTDMERSKSWYTTLFGRHWDAEPMPVLTEWHTPGGVLQLVTDEQRAGGSLATIWVPDVRRALNDLETRGGPSVALDDSTSDKVMFAIAHDPDGNSITVLQVREGVDL